MKNQKDEKNPLLLKGSWHSLSSMCHLNTGNPTYRKEKKEEEGEVKEKKKKVLVFLSLIKEIIIYRYNWLHILQSNLVVQCLRGLNELGYLKVSLPFWHVKLPPSQPRPSAAAAATYKSEIRHDGSKELIVVLFTQSLARWWFLHTGSALAVIAYLSKKS